MFDDSVVSDIDKKDVYNGDLPSYHGRTWTPYILLYVLDGINNDPTMNTAQKISKADREVVEASSEEAKKAAAILGYNYQSGDWYKKSYQVFNKKYKDKEINEKKEIGLIRKKIKSLFE